MRLYVNFSDEVGFALWNSMPHPRDGDFAAVIRNTPQIHGPADGYIRPVSFAAWRWAVDSLALPPGPDRDRYAALINHLERDPQLWLQVVT